MSAPAYVSARDIEDHLTPELEPVAPAPRRIRKGFPRELTRVPGLVGEVTEWIVSTARYPQPTLALGAALSVVGTAAGRRVSGPTASGTHLYVLALAPTGAGKNHAPKMAGKLMRAAGLGRHIGPGQFMSMSSVYDAMGRQPLLASFQDEFGALLARVNGQKASGHEKGISGVLRTLWNASFETVMPPAWASSSARKEPEPIHAPALSIYGSSTPEEFYTALSGADVANGFLNRFLLLGADTKPAEVEPEADSFEVPAQMVDALKRVAGGDVATACTLHQGQVDTPEIRVDWASAEVRQQAKTFRLELEAREADADFLTRTYEMAVRLATIRAIGHRLERPVIDGPCWAWAQAVPQWSAERMIADAREHMAEGENQRLSRMVERYIRDAGQITRTELFDKVDGRIPARLLSDLLTGLEQAGVIASGKLPQVPGKRGPPAMGYTYTRETIR